MARYTGPATRKSRRLRVDLVGGDMAFERRPYPPGQAGRNRIKESEYLLQLQEKQKAKYTYGVLEKQFRRYYAEANRRPGKTGENLVILLESRLTTLSTVLVWRGLGVRLASWFPTVTSWSMAARSTFHPSGFRSTTSSMFVRSPVRCCGLKRPRKT